MSKNMNVPKLRFGEFSGEWEKKSLSQACGLKAGKFVSASEISEIQKDNMYPCYGGNGLRGYTKTYTHDGNYSLIGRQGALCGNVQFASSKFHATEHAVVVTPIGENDSLWLYYQLNRLNLNRYATGQAQPGLSVEVIQQVKTSLPSKQEQEKIASFLSSIDTKIEQLTKKESLLQAYKKGVMQKIFNQELRFKADDGSEFCNWEEKTLKETAIKKSSNISANKIEENIGEYIIYGASGILKKVDFYEEIDDYISIVKDGAGVGRIFYCEGKTSVLGTMDIVKPKTGLNTYFLYCLLERIDFIKYIVGSTIPHIYFKDYGNERCNIPSIQEQTKIANFLSSIDKKIENTKKQLEKTKEFKKALLQQMFV